MLLTHICFHPYQLLSESTLINTNLPLKACSFVRKRNESLYGVHCWFDCSHLAVRSGVGLFITRQLALVQVLSAAAHTRCRGVQFLPIHYQALLSRLFPCQSQGSTVRACIGGECNPSQATFQEQQHQEQVHPHLLAQLLAPMRLSYRHNRRCKRKPFAGARHFPEPLEERSAPAEARERKEKFDMKTTEEFYRDFPGLVRASMPLYIKSAGPQVWTPAVIKVFCILT